MQKDILSDVGKRIAYFRKLRDLTQRDLGQMIGGRSPAVISSWENGVADPGTDNIILISEALDISPLDLLGDRNAYSFQMIVDTSEMEPYINKGDVLTVNKKASIRDGDTVLVDTTHESDLVRRFFRVGLQLLLLSANPAIPPIRTDRGNVTIKGKVTDIHRKL